MENYYIVESVESRHNKHTRCKKKISLGPTGGLWDMKQTDKKDVFFINNDDDDEYPDECVNLSR